MKAYKVSMYYSCAITSSHSLLDRIQLREQRHTLLLVQDGHLHFGSITFILLSLIMSMNTYVLARLFAGEQLEGFSGPSKCSRIIPAHVGGRVEKCRMSSQRSQSASNSFIHEICHLIFIQASRTMGTES
jgi:hypothetical protein